MGSLKRFGRQPPVENIHTESSSKILWATAKCVAIIGVGLSLYGGIILFFYLVGVRKKRGHPSTAKR